MCSKSITYTTKSSPPTMTHAAPPSPTPTPEVPDDFSDFAALLEEYDGEQAELALSLDAIYHLVEDETFCTYMSHLFSTARQYVLIYSTDEERKTKTPHVRHRNYSQWIVKNLPAWRRIRSYIHPYPRREGDDEKSTALAYFQLFELNEMKDKDVRH